MPKMTTLPIFARIGVGGSQPSLLETFFEGSDFQSDMEFYTEEGKKVQKILRCLSVHMAYKGIIINVLN